MAKNEFLVDDLWGKMRNSAAKYLINEIENFLFLNTSRSIFRTVASIYGRAF